MKRQEVEVWANVVGNQVSTAWLHRRTKILPHNLVRLDFMPLWHHQTPLGWKGSYLPRNVVPERGPPALQCHGEGNGLELCPLMEENHPWPRGLISLLVPSITFVPDSSVIVSSWPWEGGIRRHAEASQLGEAPLKEKKKSPQRSENNPAHGTLRREVPTSAFREVFP